MSFQLASTAHERRPGALSDRDPPPHVRSLADSAPLYQPSNDLLEAVNVALSLGAPLLLTGEPGTGKTQVAHYLRWYFGLPDAALFEFPVRSNTQADHLTARFDAVAYFRAANDPKREGALEKAPFVVKGKLWQAYDYGSQAIVLVDEVDKAPRDFPNDLLMVLDQHWFEAPETGDRIEAPTPPPLMVITSNSERRLPEPFLRRCVFHHIAFEETLVERAVQAHLAQLPGLPGDVSRAAVRRFWEIRGQSLRKKPATGELLVWLAALRAMGLRDAEAISACPAWRLPGVSALVKDREDIDTLKG